MAGLGGGELILVFAVILLIFGGSQLPKLAKSLGQAQKEFKKAQTEEDTDDGPSSSPSQNA
ncbi:MAG: twin-arginine translocase TatA/TatE family subunit [Acidimicrobiales bacterium]|jgi:sec-independent protein translocase protein TatA|nr:twin-arginine translocase TatA/TatE family subunit [Acidimicrobiales bacterium]